MKEMTLKERQDLDQLEAVVDSGLAGFLKTGYALLEIHDRKLYRETHDGDWVGYCRERFEMSSRHALRLIRAAEAVKDLQSAECKSDQIGPMGGKKKKAVPETEAQARELPLDREDRQKVWKNSLDSNDGKPPTAAQVKAARTALERLKGLSAKEKEQEREEEEERVNAEEEEEDRRNEIQRLRDNLAKEQDRAQRLGAEDVAEAIRRSLEIAKKLK